jgi:hypothetical protein
MKVLVKAGLEQAMALAFVGLATGVIGGWVSLAFADGAAAVAAISGAVFLSLVAWLPLALMLMTKASLVDADRVHYQTVGGALVVTLIGGLLGAIIGMAFYLVVAINVPAIFGGEDQADLRVALLTQIGWQGTAWVVGVTTACAVFLASWAHRRSTESR